jgi:hypothetical protein
VSPSRTRSLICSELLLDHLRVPTGYPSAQYWWLLRAVDLSGSTPSQRHFSRVSNNRQLALFRPLKAVARVRIPSGLPWKTAADQAWYRHQPASISLGSTVRDARGTQELPPVLPSAQLQISRLRLPNMGSSAGRTCAVARLDLVWDRQAPWNDAPRRSSVITGRRGNSICRRPPSTAICLKDAGRRQKLAIAGGFPTIHLSARTGGEK